MTNFLTYTQSKKMLNTTKTFKTLLKRTDSIAKHKNKN